jgi:hypothetical protein
MSWVAIGVIADVFSAIAVIVSLLYLARQLSTSNRLARAEAFRSPNSDLNAMNATYSTIPEFNQAIRQVFAGAIRKDIPAEQRAPVDAYLVSVTNVYEQLNREVREGILTADAYKSFGAQGLFRTPYYRDSWCLYRNNLSENFVDDFEKRFDLDPTIESDW